jgi:16S rRNA (uracil1498-N3)-methyltransferase
MDATFARVMTGSIRLFVDHPLYAGTEVPATGEQAHYLGHVMRRGVGDKVLLFNGRDGEVSAEMTAIRKDRAVFRVVSVTRLQEQEVPRSLVFAALKRDANEWMIEKATELGVSRLCPVFTERTNTARLNLDRLGSIAREAAEQCERLSVPAIDPPVDLHQLLAAWPAGLTLSAAIERSDAPPPQPAAGPAALLVGPEGGFTRAELDALRRLPFVEPICLGPRILRAETAAVVGLALLQARPVR